MSGFESVHVILDYIKAIAPSNTGSLADFKNASDLQYFDAFVMLLTADEGLKTSLNPLTSWGGG